MYVNRVTLLYEAAPDPATAECAKVYCLVQEIY
jgi:hypothetical protein